MTFSKSKNYVLSLAAPSDTAPAGVRIISTEP
jgi:hypothetical protein